MGARIVRVGGICGCKDSKSGWLLLGSVLVGSRMVRVGLRLVLVGE